ncbi:MAG: hypothetical protein WAK48_01820 [Candidatus Acidiferrum sp.]|jgi:predicted RNase H-like HicB family nuclease
MTNASFRRTRFEVIEEEDGGYVAACLSENIVTHGDTWNELHGNVKDAVEAFFFDELKPQSIRLHLVRNEVFQLQ